MDLRTVYFVYGTASDTKTQDLLELAKQKGVNLTLKDMSKDPKTHADFLSRGYARIPVVLKEGRPNLAFIGDYEAAQAELSALPDFDVLAATVQPTQPAPVEQIDAALGFAAQPHEPISEIQSSSPILASGAATANSSVQPVTPAPESVGVAENASPSSQPAGVHRDPPEEEELAA